MCPYYWGVCYSWVSPTRELTVLRLERQEKDFLKSTSNSHVTLSFLFIWNWNDIYVHAFPRKPYPNSDQSRQNLYQFSDQNGPKTIPFGVAHTKKANKIEYPPLPSPPQGYRMKHSSLCYPKFSITYRFVTFCAEPQVSSRLGVGLQNKNNKISLNEKELFPSYKTVDIK